MSITAENKLTGAILGVNAEKRCKHWERSRSSTTDQEKSTPRDAQSYVRRVEVEDDGKEDRNRFREICLLMHGML